MTDNEKAPWTIKAVPVATRELAIRKARQAGQTVAEWLTDLVQQHADLEQRTAILPPQQAGQAVVAADPSQIDPVPAVTLDMTTLAQAYLAAVATTGTPLPAGLNRDLAGLLRDQVRSARGMAPLRRRRGGATEE